MILMQLLTVSLAALLVPYVAAQKKHDEEKPTVDLRGGLADSNLRKERPENSLVLSQKSWEKLVKAWGIKDAPKVDFTKEFLFVATTVERELRVFHAFGPDRKGELKLIFVASGGECPGYFCYAIKSISKEGVKTVNGKELSEDISPAERK
jgi:hypothetical protein